MNVKMSEQQNNKYAKEFLKGAYDMELLIPIKINARLSKVLDRFRDRNNKSCQIEYLSSTYSTES